MRTDIPLKRLMALCAADLLPLFGMPDAQLIAVETLEMPASATRLDNVLHLRSPRGQEFLHVVEWQGYYDPAMLWRMLSYLAWLGQRNPRLPIIGSIVYLAPEHDVGDTLEQIIDGQVMQTFRLSCVRLWEQDAQAALATGNAGLVALSPLMRNADANLVQQAAALLINQAPLPRQADLLSILGVFAEPFLTSDRFLRFVGKERLMASDLLSYLMEEKTAEIEAKVIERVIPEAIQQGRQEGLQQGLQQGRQEGLQQGLQQGRQEGFQEGIQRSLYQVLDDAITARFPQAPYTLAREVQRITQPEQLRSLILAVFQAADLSAFEQQVAQAIAAASSDAAGSTLQNGN